MKLLLRFPDWIFISLSSCTRSELLWWTLIFEHLVDFCIPFAFLIAHNVVEAETITFRPWGEEIKMKRQTHDRRTQFRNNENNERMDENDGKNENDKFENLLEIEIRARGKLNDISAIIFHFIMFYFCFAHFRCKCFLSSIVQERNKKESIKREIIIKPNHFVKMLIYFMWAQHSLKMLSNKIWNNFNSNEKFFCFFFVFLQAANFGETF